MPRTHHVTSRSYLAALAIVAAWPGRAWGDEPAADETIVIEDHAPALAAPTAGTRVVDAGTLQATPHRSAEDLLRLAPGLLLSQHGSAGKAQQFFLRGVDAVHGQDLAVRLAGVPLNERGNVHGHGYLDLGMLIPELVSSMVVREGPFDIEQGPFATAGSIDLELGVPSDQRGARVTYELGSTNRHRALARWAPVGGADGEVVALELARDAGFAPGRRAEHVTLLGATRQRVGAHGWVAPNAIAYAARFGNPGVVPLADVASGYFARADAPAAPLDGTSTRALVSVRAGWEHADRAAHAQVVIGHRGLRLDENFTGWLDDAVRGDARRQAHQAAQASADLSWEQPLGPSLRVRVGASAGVDRLGQTEDRITLAGTPWRRDREVVATLWSGGVRGVLAARRGAWSATLGVRLDAEATRAFDRLTATRGGGFSYALLPRVVVARAWPRVTASLALGRGARPPEPRAWVAATDLENLPTDAYQGGEPRMIVADSSELAARIALGARAAITAAAFASYVEREQIFDHVAGTVLELDGARRLGGDLALELAPRAWLVARLGGSAVDARFLRSGNPVPGAPRLLGTAEVRVATGPWQAAAIARGIGARPLAHGARGATSVVLDATASWRRGRLGLELSIDNALDAAWAEGEYHYASWWDQGAPRSALPRLHAVAGYPLGARLAITLDL